MIRFSTLLAACVLLVAVPSFAGGYGCNKGQASNPTEAAAKNK